jgi:serine/threonine protein kinase
MLATGIKLGPYEILGPLGAGGMGEVYRARDTRLGRDVAVKVLPSSFSRDPERLHRFEQEARAAGLLNHPNILALYDIGQADSLPYVVTELLEGETLGERLRAGALNQRKAIDYAVQIAHGLATAHEKGIVHRDLKPENLFITSDGRIKILDFGLAKLTRPEDSANEATSAGTVSMGTEPGKVMGTVGYMSPEQVRGQTADHRSDIFSFGAILYEMLSGKRAFQRDSGVETMTAILKEDPPDLVETNQKISPAIERVVSHCLEKSPAQRFQSARDLAFALEAVSGTSGSATGAVAKLATERATLPIKTIAGAIAALLIVAAVAFFLGKRLGRTPLPAFHQLTFRRGTIMSARFSPDGQTIIYGAKWEGKPIELFSTRPGSPEFTHVDVPSAEILAISSTSELALLLHPQYISTAVYSGTLAWAPMAGGTPREVLENVQYADWSPDGKDLAVVRVEGRKYRLEYPMGKVIYEPSEWLSHIRVSPDGERVAFIEHKLFSDDRGSVAVVDRAGKVTSLTKDYASADGLTWTPDGREIWYTGAEEGNDRALHAVSLSGRVRLLTQTPGALTIQDISPNGRVLMTSDIQRRGILGLVPGSTAERDLSWLDWSYCRALSDDGKMLLFDEQGVGAGNKYAVCLRKTDGSPAVQLGEGYACGLSPDGRWALSVIPYASPPRIMLLPTGAGESKALTDAPFYAFFARWFPDGKRVAIQGHEPGHGDRIYAQDLADGKMKPIAPEGVLLAYAGITPDGRYSTGILPDGKPVLCAVESGQCTAIQGVEAGDISIRWSSDGRTLYVYRKAEIPCRIFEVDVQTGKRKPWKAVMPNDPAGITSVSPIIMTPDTKYYVYGYTRFLSDLYLVDGLK